jgi:glycosyltransferase involved in cell wall biosynthesis
MKVTFVMASLDLSGGNRVIAIYADRLRRRGHDVTIVSRPRPPVTLKEQLRCWFRGYPIPKNIHYGPSHLDKIDGIEHVRIDRFRPIVVDDVPDADVVIATWWETAEWVASYPPSKGAKAYFIQHYETHYPQPVERVEATWRSPLHKIIIAQWLANIARDRYGDTDISMVPNAVDSGQFNAPPRGKQSTPTIGVMYSVSSFKGCDISLKAVEFARQRVPELKLLSFGNREQFPTMPLPPGTDYTLLPAQDRIKEIYARCDAWLVGSRSEGFGLPILEAMACRTPVIATPTGAAPELLKPGGGVLVPMEDPAAMAAEIERIVRLTDREWRRMSDIAHETATKYTWDDAAGLFEAALGRAREKATTR